MLKKWWLALVLASIVATPAAAKKNGYFDFEGLALAPGAAMAVGPVIALGDYRLTAVAPTSFHGEGQCLDADCLVIAAPDYLGVNNTAGNFLLLKQGYSLQVRDVAGSEINVRSANVGSLGAPLNPFADVTIIVPPGDPNIGNSIGIGMTPIGGGIFSFEVQPDDSIKWGSPIDWLALNVGGPGGPRSVYYDHIWLTDSVPEPAVWCMLFMGFGFLGARLRQRRPRCLRTEPARSAG